MGASQQALLTGATSAGITAGALDAFATNLWAVYGITRQRTSSVYAGPAIRVRKSTGGDTVTEQDINFSGTALDTSTLSAFAGSETVVVVTLYDQSGNSRDLTTATGSKQPRIVNAGSYDGFLRFDGTDDELLTSATSGTPSELSTSAKATYRTDTVTQVVYACGPGGGGHSIAQLYIPLTGGQLDVYIANSAGSIGDRIFNTLVFPRGPNVGGVVHQLGAASAALACRYYDNGTELTLHASAGSNPTGSFTAETWRLGSGGGANFAQINVYSFAVWEANQATSMASIATAMA